MPFRRVFVPNFLVGDLSLPNVLTFNQISSLGACLVGEEYVRMGCGHAADRLAVGLWCAIGYDVGSKAQAVTSHR
jgi:hypothetical protein